MLPRMGRRLLHYRFAFALCGAVALVVAGPAQIFWLAVAGAATAGVSECIGIAQSRVRFPEPLSRVWRGSAEALPAVGVAAFEPYALGLAVVVILFALFASGMRTVSQSRGLMLGQIPGETLRRVLTAFCSLSLLAIPVLRALEKPVHGWMAPDARSLAMLMTAVAALVSLRVLLDIALEIRRAGRRVRGPNVDS